MTQWTISESRETYSQIDGLPINVSLSFDGLDHGIMTVRVHDWEDRFEDEYLSIQPLTKEHFLEGVRANVLPYSPSGDYPSRAMLNLRIGYSLDLPELSFPFLQKEIFHDGEYVKLAGKDRETRYDLVPETFAITSDMMNAFGLTEEDLFNATESNRTLYLNSARDWKESYCGYVGHFVVSPAFADCSYEKSLNRFWLEGTGIYMASTSGIFSKGGMEEVAEAVGGDYYALPFSLAYTLILATPNGTPPKAHEVQYLAERMGKYEQDFSKLIEENPIDRAFRRKDALLSCLAYRFDSNSHELLFAWDMRKEKEAADIGELQGKQTGRRKAR